MYCDGVNKTDGRVAAPDRRYGLAGPVLTLVSLILFVVNTRRGIAIYPDTTRYMGLNELPYDAPIYAWLVRLPSLLGVDIAYAAEGLGLFFVAANTFMIWHLLIRATRDYRYAVIGTALIVVAPQFVAMHASAMSEPPFLFFIFATLVTILRYVDTGKRLWLITSAVILGIASLTRFTGPALGAAIAGTLLLNPQVERRRRIADAVVYGLVSGSVFLSWVAFSHFWNGRSIGRRLWFYGNMGREDWLDGLESLMAWLLPDQVPNVLRTAVLVAFLMSAFGVILIHARRTLDPAGAAKPATDFLPLLLGLFVLSYMGFMILAITIEANLRLNGRYALPAYIMTVMAVTIALARLNPQTGAGRLVHHAMVALALVVLCSHSVRTTVRSLDAYRSGVGYASTEWTRSPTMLAVGKLPAGALIYSNGPDAITYVLKRPAHFIPERFQLRTGIEDPSNPFEQQLARLKEASTSQHAYIVVFDKITWRFYRASEAELKEYFPLVMLESQPDGRIYEVRPSTPGE